MRKYIRTPKKLGSDDFDYWGPPLLENITVFEHEQRPVFTGLLDKQGYELVAVEKKRPIGFIKTK